MNMPIRTFATCGLRAGQPVDPQAGIIYDVSIAQAVEATGHRLYFDQLTLSQLVALGNASAKGIKGAVCVIIDGGDFTIDAADDGIHSNGSVVINGGTFTIASGDDGIHADASLEINGGDIHITDSYEGIESAIITINDGNIHILASDDGINVAGGKDGSGMNPALGAGGRPGRGPGQDAFSTASGNYFLYIHGGYVVVEASGDGIDVMQVLVKNNQEVKKGQTIAVLDTEDAFRDIESAELSLRSAELKQKQVDDQYNQETKEDRWQRQTQEVSVKQSRNNLDKAKQKLQDYYIKAPFDGVVTGLSVEAGDSVSRSTVLASVITHDMRAAVSLNEVDAAKVKEGDSVTLTFDALPDLELSGKVSRIDTIGTVTQNVVSYDAEIVFDEQRPALADGLLELVRQQVV